MVGHADKQAEICRCIIIMILMDQGKTKFGLLWGMLSHYMKSQWEPALEVKIVPN